jgi:hypothetical protein
VSWSLEARHEDDMQTFLRCSILVSILAFSACGGDDSTVEAAPHSESPGHSDHDGSAGDTGPDAGPGSDGGTTGPIENGDAGSGDTDGPTIQILEPKGASDPNADTIVTTSKVTVRCKVTRSPSRSAHDVNQSSVAIVAHSGKDGLAGVVTAEADDTFTADFNLADFANGPLSFTCTADDVAMPPKTGSATADTFLDLGPEIKLIEPMDMSNHALKDVVNVKFAVKASPMDATDKEATPKNIVLDASGQNIKFTESPSQPGLYTASINFNDKKRFPMAPTTSAVVVSAESSRTPKAATRRERVDINLDAEGPAISVASPMNLSIVRGDVVLTVNVSDPSGIKPDSLTGAINVDLFPLVDWTGGGSSFSTRFDTRQFGTTLTQLTINIRVSDSVGNESTVAHVLRLDNVPPTISLDPPPIREVNGGDSNNQLCSAKFDPVGTDAVSDLELVSVSSLYRVMVVEDTNHSPGGLLDYVAGVKSSSVVLFAQGDPSIPLLIDTNKDGTCDEINSKDSANTIQIPLLPLTVRGSAYYSNMPDLTDAEKNGTYECKAGTATTPPNTLCALTEMTRAIPQPIGGNPPAIYAFAPTNGSGPVEACEGDTWELQPSVGNGWACLAARVEDNIGNVGVSPPIRVCVWDGTGSAPCDPMNETPPDCTSGCSWPRDFPDGWIQYTP